MIGLVRALLPGQKDDVTVLNPRPVRGKGIFGDSIDPSAADYLLSEETKSLFGQHSRFNANPSEAYIEQLQKKHQGLVEAIPRIREASTLQIEIMRRANEIQEIEVEFHTNAMEEKGKALDRETEHNNNVKSYANRKRTYVQQREETLRLLKGA